MKVKFNENVKLKFTAFRAKPEQKIYSKRKEKNLLQENFITIFSFTYKPINSMAS